MSMWFVWFWLSVTEISKIVISLLCCIPRTTIALSTEKPNFVPVLARADLQEGHKPMEVDACCGRFCLGLDHVGGDEDD